jgi:hypothetical protein
MITKRYAIARKLPVLVGDTSSLEGSWSFHWESDDFNQTAERFRDTIFAYDASAMVTCDGLVIYEFAQRQLASF